MFEQLEEEIPERVQALLYLYIYLAVPLIILTPSVLLSFAFLVIQGFAVYWNIKREGVLYNHWKTLWRDLKGGSL